MLMLIVIVIIMGLPTAFTLMGLGMLFGFASYNPAEHWIDNRVFDLMVQPIACRSVKLLVSSDMPLGISPSPCSPSSCLASPR